MATGDGPDEPDLEDDDPDFSPNSLSESEGNAWPELDELEPDNHQEDWLEQEAWGVPDVEEGGMDAASGPRTRAQASQMGHSMVGALGQSLHEEPGAETGWQDEPAALPPFMINLHNAADLVEWYKFKKELWQDLEQGTAECKGNGNLARPQGTKRRRKEECKRPEDRSMSHHHLSVLSSQMNAHAQLLMQVHAAASSLEGYEQVAERTNSLLMDLSGTSKSRLNSLRHRASPLAPFYPAHVAVRDAWKGYSKVHKELDGNVLGPSSFHCCQLRTPLEVPALMRIDDFLVRFSDLRYECFEHRIYICLSHGLIASVAPPSGRGMIPVKGEKETSEGDHCYDSVPSCVHEGPLHLLGVL